MTDNIINFPDPEGKYKVDYVFDGDKVVGVSHPDWGFRIMRNKAEDKIAIVCEETNEPFGILDADVFNTILLCWLLIDDPKMIDDAAV